MQDNGGGTIDSTLELLSLFLLKNTPLVQFQTKTKKIVFRSRNNHPVIDISLLVLLNYQSASASEVFANALICNKRAIAAGCDSYGKNLAQVLLCHIFIYFT